MSVLTEISVEEHVPKDRKGKSLRFKVENGEFSMVPCGVWVPDESQIGTHPLLTSSQRIIRVPGVAALCIDTQAANTSQRYRIFQTLRSFFASIDAGLGVVPEYLELRKSDIVVTINLPPTGSIEPAYNVSGLKTVRDGIIESVHFNCESSGRRFQILGQILTTVGVYMVTDSCLRRVWVPYPGNGLAIQTSSPTVRSLQDVDSSHKYIACPYATKLVLGDGSIF